jgi:hypothetical protein
MEIRKGAVIWAVCGPTDMRCQIKGLSAIVENIGSKRLFDNHFYVFCGKTRHIIKVLYYGFKGYCVYQKKFEETFFWPMDNTEMVRIANYNKFLKLLQGQYIWNDKVKSEKQKGYNKTMIEPFPDKETLEKVIQERKEDFNQRVKTGYVNGAGGAEYYIDKKGLVHMDGPRGRVVSFIGWTKEQMKTAENEDSILPLPR